MLGKMPHEITHKSTVRALGFIRIYGEEWPTVFGIQGLQGGGGKGKKPFESYESEGLGVQTQNAGLILIVVCGPEDI